MPTRRRAAAAAARSPPRRCRAASLRAMPAATSRSTSARASRTASVGRLGRTWRRARPAADHQGELAAGRDPPVGAAPRPARRAVPRTIFSWSFVSSRQTAAGRSAPQAAARSARVAATRPGASYSTRRAVVGGDARQALATLAAAARQEPLERPARAGDARCRRRPRARPRHPGIGTTVPPSAAQAATSSPPGIADAGRPGVGHQGEVLAAPRGGRAAPRPGPGALRAW